MRVAIAPTVLRALMARADAPPSTAREALWLGGAQVGTLEPALGEALAGARLPVSRCATGWRIDAAVDAVDEPDADAAFERIARWLHGAGLTPPWRGELLAVTDTTGAARARIERVAVRPLGIATRAVHLVGRAQRGGVWVQQRAFDKATDPGCWDTLVGGLQAAGESDAVTLARETWEEAGLRVTELLALQPRAGLTIRRPVADGYMVERIAVFTATLPEGRVPNNLDGEVAHFACLDEAELRERLERGDFTLEAALILAAVLAKP